MMKRVGLFGGTFDPPTIAHLIAAEWTREELNLDEVWFMPAWQNPLKTKNGISSPEIRLEMLENAVIENDNFIVNTIEFARKGLSYTYDTIKQIKSENQDKEFYLIQGTDAILQIEEWYRWDDLLDEVKFVVLTRPGFDPVRISEGTRRRITLLQMPELDLSATLVRERVHSGKSIKYLVPESVIRVIEKYSLYL